MITLNVENKSTSPAWLKITVVDQPDAWRLVEIPDQETVRIDLGAMDYELQLVDGETGEGASNTLRVSDDAAVAITGGFDIFIPGEN